MTLSNVPRPEYPRPQMVRKDWLNLNGQWQFEIDYGNSGKHRNFQNRDTFNDKIIVPFCPESKLSEIEHKDFMTSVWYKRDFEIPDNWKDKKTLIHFGAVDYKAEVWINGVYCGTHQGGYTPFSFDITKNIVQGVNTVTINAIDDVRSTLQPKGKQASLYYSSGCDYTRTTGIWQTVWLECVPDTYIESFNIIPDPDNNNVSISTFLCGNSGKILLSIKAFLNGNEVGAITSNISGQDSYTVLNLSEISLWEPGNGVLYDLEFKLIKDGEILDEVSSYFGLRNVTIDGMAILINGKKVFQRLVLDQGFYPDGIYTAPTDEDLKRDIELSMALGFNGARLHEKIFEPRFLYWADKLGYLVWGEHANWGLNISEPIGLQKFLPEWIEGVKRDFNHPSIVGWCPFNETWDDSTGKRQNDDILKIIYNVTKQLDKTRPVIDTSGNYHVATDIFDIHDYDQNPESFALRHEDLKNGGDPYINFSDRQQYGGQPYFISEYGGIQWNADTTEGWGYGEKPKSEQEFIERYKGLTDTLLQNPNMCGFCYTQLYDIEQEINGLYTYHREPKFDPEIFKAINSQQAAIEK